MPKAGTPLAIGELPSGSGLLRVSLRALQAHHFNKEVGSAEKPLEIGLSCWRLELEVAALVLPGTVIAFGRCVRRPGK
jgi:hypothetical protein